MKTKSKLDGLPSPIKAELIAKILAASATYEELAAWLYEAHGQRHSKSAVGRFAQAVKSLHGGLVDLGMSPTVLANHAGRLEKLGALLVQRAFLDRRISALQKVIFDDV
ncbi:phage protein Gp27 family protein [Methylomonas koyamae]|uniref:Uncharacterized protein n=1 Tax=Methylomonas koyamae TaxID=702114 RepID=A0A291IFS9_9GAMM|nr:phage protein Gp27 family protein [Methylomonas koyamae]ATG89119.1 hypothetical protein MKLM6_0847 [Methylomonas koyamae]OAI24568.1 hypothetical protein A1356_15525 [Methylomonas koyamae]